MAIFRYSPCSKAPPCRKKVHPMKRLVITLLATTLLLVIPVSGAQGQHKRELMRDAHALVFNHAAVSRTVEKLPNGVRTITTTSDPALLPVLRRHPREMGDMYKAGGMVRGWDPVFRELAVVSDKVHMEVKDIEGGVGAIATSDDPQVVKLIQAHADKVSEMVQRGAPAMREATALPSDYVRPGESGTPAGDGIAEEARVPWDGKLVQYGSMHETIGQQQHEGRVSLREVAQGAQFYGVGALEGLQGEITFLGGVPTATRFDVENGLMAIDTTTDDLKATLLVGAYVPYWTELVVERTVQPEAFDEYIAKAAEASGIDTTKPFVFAIDGIFMDIRLHVINGACPLHARLKKAEISKEKIPYELEQPEIFGTIVGVYASDAVGKLTHPDTATHNHLLFFDIDSGDPVTGHVEKVGISAASVLYLPAVK